MSGLDFTRTDCGLPDDATAFAEARCFVAALAEGVAPDCYFQLRTLHYVPGQEHAIPWSRFFRVSQLDELIRVAFERDRLGENAYITVHPRRSQSAAGEAIAGIWLLVADVDYGSGKRHATKHDARTQIDALSVVGLRPSMVVDTGHGFHLYWFLHEPLAPTEYDAARITMLRLAQDLGGDNIADAARILRIPATSNRKPNRAVCAVRLIECDPALRYDLSDFDDVLSPLREDAFSGSGTGTWKGDLPIDLSPLLRRVLVAVALRYTILRDKRTGGIRAIMLRDCPACAAETEARAGATRRSAHISPFIGALRCFREKCPARGSGIPLREWVTRYAPHAISALYPDAPSSEVERESNSELCRSLHDVGERLPALIRQAIQWAAEDLGRVAIVIATVGLGKTYYTLTQFRALVQREIERVGRGTFLAASHRALDEREAEAEVNGVADRLRLYGALSYKGPGACVFEENLRPYYKRGFPLVPSCLACSYRTDHPETGEDCVSFTRHVRRGDGEGVVLFGTHQHGALLDLREYSPIVVDELPNLLDTLAIPLDDLRLIANEQVWSEIDAWCEPRRPFAALGVGAARFLLDEWKRAPQRYARYVVATELRGNFLAAAARRVLGERCDPVAILAESVASLRNELATPFPSRKPPRPPNHRMLYGTDAAERWPRWDSDLILQALADEIESVPDRKTWASFVVNDEGVRIEVRRRFFDRWPVEPDGRPLSLVILDATAASTRSAIRAAMPGREIREFRLSLADPPCVRRVHIVAPSSMSRRSLLTGGALSPRGSAALVRALRIIVRRLPEERSRLAIISHKPVAEIFSAARAVLDGKDDTGVCAQRIATAGADDLLEAFRRLREDRLVGSTHVLHFGALRGSNEAADCDALVVFGEAWCNIGAAEEDARALGMPSDVLTRGRLDAEVTQSLGRARGPRRGPDQPVTLFYVGAERPADWAGKPVETIPLPAGGPTPSEVSENAAELFGRMLTGLGVSSASLVRAIGRNPRLYAELTKTELTAIEDSLYCSWFRLEPFESFAEAALLADRTLRDVEARALGRRGSSTTPDPTGAGRYWRWRELRPGTARFIAEFVRLCVARVPQDAEQAVPSPIEVLTVSPPSQGAEESLRATEVELVAARENETTGKAENAA